MELVEDAERAALGLVALACLSTRAVNDATAVSEQEERLQGNRVSRILLNALDERQGAKHGCRRTRQ